MYLFNSLSALLLLVNVAQITAQSVEYVYAYSWTPGFCHNQQYPGCLDPESYWTTNFTIHGLWPQYNTTGYPSFCSDEPFDPAIPELIGMNTMTTYWPDVQYDETSPSYDSFWEHEWTKHGTCSGLSQYDYFNKAIQLSFSIPTPDILYNSIGKNISADELRDSFGGNDKAILQCVNQQLTGLYTCWSEMNDGSPNKQIVCPASVLNEDTCKKSDQVMVLAL
jgi:ribonuclease T2